MPSGPSVVQTFLRDSSEGRPVIDCIILLFSEISDCQQLQVLMYCLCYKMTLCVNDAQA